MFIGTNLMFPRENDGVVRAIKIRNELKYINVIARQLPD